MTRLFRLGGPAVLLTVLSLAGCSDDPAPGPDPTPSTSASEPGEEAPPPGTVMDLPSASVTLPGDWKVKEGLLSGMLEARRGPVTVFLTDLGTTTNSTPRALARLSAESYDPGEIDVTYDAELGGEPGYQLLRRVPDLPATYEYGAGYMGRAAIVGIAFSGSSTPAEEKQLVEEILAGFVWN